MANLKKQFCPKGHDTFVTGRDKQGRCPQCKKEAHPLKRGQPLKQFCSKGHDKDIVGRYPSGGCIQCQKDYNNTPEKKEQHKQYVLTHRAEITAKSRKRIKAWKLLTKYNLTVEDYNKLLEKQNRLCAGCDRSQDEFKNLLSVDHDHSCCSGAKSCGKCIRGLLCQPCNLILGNAQDNIETFKRLIKYLRKWK